MNSTSGPDPPASGGVPMLGPASAKMISAAVIKRNNSSQAGVRAGVSSALASPSSRRKGGKTTRRGAGGVTRSNHQIAGSAASAARIQGVAKLRPAIIAQAPRIVAAIPPRLA